MRVAITALLLAVLSAPSAAAQGLDTYITAGSGSIDYLVYRETIPQASVGVLWRAVGDRLRLGGEADVFTSNGYFSGRGGPLAEIALVRRARVRPFVRGGYFFGEDNSWILGGGLDLWLTERSAIRVFVQDAFRGLEITYGNPGHHVFHEPSVQVGWVWR
jgi:hypothetical protein